MRSLENRIPPPLVALIVAAVMWGGAHAWPPLAMNAVVRYGVAVVFFALSGFFAFPAFLAFRRARTTVDPIHIDRASTIVSTGIYRITRNPMYVSLTFLLLTWAVYLAAPWSLLGPVVFVAFITRFQILPEERVMTTKFGAAYLEYKSGVRRWL